MSKDDIESILSVYILLTDESLPVESKKKLAKELFRSSNRLDGIMKLILDSAFMSRASLLQEHKEHFRLVVDNAQRLEAGKQLIERTIELAIIGTNLKLIKNTFAQKSKHIYKKHSLRGEENNISKLVLEREDIALTISLVRQRIDLEFHFFCNEEVSSSITISYKQKLIASLKPKKNKAFVKSLQLYRRYDITMLNSRLVLKT